jgi:hypothetical protein
MSAVFDPFAMPGVHPAFSQVLAGICPPAVAEYAVTVRYQLPADAAIREAHAVMVCAGQQRPDAAALVPKDGELLSALVMPLKSLIDMDLQRRPAHKQLYRAYLLHKVGKAKGKPASELVRDDYDPVSIDNDMRAWVKGGSYRVYWGD